VVVLSPLDNKKVKSLQFLKVLAGHKGCECVGAYIHTETCLLVSLTLSHARGIGQKVHPLVDMQEPVG